MEEAWHWGSFGSVMLAVQYISPQFLLLVALVMVFSSRNRKVT